MENVKKLAAGFLVVAAAATLAFYSYAQVSGNSEGGNASVETAIKNDSLEGSSKVDSEKDYSEKVESKMEGLENFSKLSEGERAIFLRQVLKEMQPKLESEDKIALIYYDDVKGYKVKDQDNKTSPESKKFNDCFFQAIVEVIKNINSMKEDEFVKIKQLAKESVGNDNSKKEKIDKVSFEDYKRNVSNTQK